MTDEKEGNMQDTTLPLDGENESSAGNARLGSGPTDDGANGTPEGGAGSQRAAPTESTEPVTETAEAEPPEEPEAPPVPLPAKLPVKLEAQTGGVLAIIPRNLDEAAKLARGIIASGIVPRAFRFSETIRGEGDVILQRKGDVNEPLVIMGVLKSLEIGLPPITGLSYLLPINDRFTIWGDGAVALAQAHGLIENHARATIGPALEPGLELADWPDEYGVEVRYWRKGQRDPYVGRFTVGDAKRARLWMNTDKKPWVNSPDRMLFNRARAFALRDGFADALSGLAIAEEVRDMSPEPVDGGELKAQANRKALLLDDNAE
jgi:hypothetical protein